ncbi:MAG: FAD-dependent oxidoreductase [Planctomycetota bacterium]|nr:FAD-dependent oxidoreductase [Planctomycetota bacterium]
MSKKRIIILGGGFAGANTALQLERRLRRRNDVEIVLVSKENYMVFQPMLPEVISGNIGILDTVTPIRRLAPKTQLYIRSVKHVDVEKQQVTLSPGFDSAATVLEYDHLVVTLGNVADFRQMPGLHDHAFPFKNLVHALRLRDHLIHVLSEAAITTDPSLRQQLLTFVIGGGGFSGVKVCAELNDFVRDCARRYFSIDPNEIRVVLVHDGERILNREMPDKLALYAQDLLKKRGVEFIFKMRLQTATPEFALLANGDRIPTRTLVSSVPSSPNPVVLRLDVPLNRGRIEADLKMQVKGFRNVWALGDCALIPNPKEDGFCPPTAQFAVRQAKTCADNVVAAIDDRPQTDFTFSELGKMASLGHRRAIIRMFDMINLHGFVAWLIWRMAYWVKLPGFDRKIKVGMSWLMDIFCGRELVQTGMDQPTALIESHYETGEMVAHKGDSRTGVSIILAGAAEILSGEDGDEPQVIGELGPGDCFGVSEFLEKSKATHSIRCRETMDVVTYRKQELEPLLLLPEFRRSFENLRLENKE